MLSLRKLDAGCQASERNWMPNICLCVARLFKALLTRLYFNPTKFRTKLICLLASFFCLLLFLAPGASALHTAMVTLAWDSNDEPDLAGYRVYYGPTSNNYKYSVDVGKVNSCTISGLVEGKTYYFAATAYDTNMNESEFSLEIDYLVPTIDTDGDGYTDSNDDFPDDPTEWLDTDDDGIGNNADEDDDGDGMPDFWEDDHELNPLVDDAQNDQDGDGVPNLEEYLAGTDPQISSQNYPPYQPVLQVPDDGREVNSTPLFQTNAYDDPDVNDFHAKSRWQIFREQDDVCVLDISSDVSLISLTVPRLILVENTSYRWRVRFYDNLGAPSPWSEFYAFKTMTTGKDMNGDGIADHQEADALSDLDSDGVADNQQDRIKSIKTREGDIEMGVSFEGDPAVLAIEAIESGHSNAVIEAQDKPDGMPYGVIYFKLNVKNPGNQAVITIYFSETIPQDAIWYKLDAAGSQWLDYSDYAEISPDRRSISLFLEDGGIGDADGVANGIIVDPAGLGIESQAVATSGGGDGGGGGCFISTATQNSSSSDQPDFFAKCKEWILFLIK